MNNIDICLVVPTIRENCFRDFVSRWDAIGLFNVVDLIIVEDNPHKTFNAESCFASGVEHAIFKRDGLTHTCWENIDALVNSQIIPRRSDTVRSFGYLLAYMSDKKYKYIMTLDDDCYPCTPEDGMTYDGVGFVTEHLRWLTSRSKWFNTLNNVTPRGIPYYNRGTNDSVVINHGLWTNVLDYDAPRQLVAPEKERFSFDNKVVPHGVYFPMCGMNVMWKREATVLMYHLLMGNRTNGSFLSRLPFDRFGDIWCGIIAKKICDLNNMSMSTGIPYIRHERASNPFTNLKKEANGLEVNEKFWQYIDSFIPSGRMSPGSSREDSSIWLYSDIGMHIKKFNQFDEYTDYFYALGNSMQHWAAEIAKCKKHHEQPTSYNL